MATPQPAVATAIKAFAVEPSTAGFCQTCRCWIRQALDQPRKPDCSYQRAMRLITPVGCCRDLVPAPGLAPRRSSGEAEQWWLRGDALRWGEVWVKWTTMHTLLGVSTRIWDLKPCYVRACTRLRPFPAAALLSWGLGLPGNSYNCPCMATHDTRGATKMGRQHCQGTGAAGSGIITRRRVKKVRWSQEQTVPLSPGCVTHPLLRQPPACPATGTGGWL